ncbi:MAG TPA: SdpI family protein [Gammaproteobacteria bacterium]|nr:SdpI family protein [Gammaproteobacteria bacterium]
MTYKRAVWLGFVLVLAAFAVAGWLYPQLPQSVPTHWNTAGQPNQFIPKPWGPFILPLVMLGAWILMSILPPIAPRGYRLDRFIGTYGVLMLTVLAALLVLTIVMLIAAEGARFDSTRIVFIVVGALFIVLGNYLGKLRKNFFIGIRTPWTLANDEVWARTHRLGGWLFVLAGFAIIVIGVLKLGPGPFVAAVGCAALIPAGYSYIAYRQIEQGGLK